MASEGLHEPADRLTAETIDAHRGFASLIEELEAIDWYRQRADDAEDEALRGILLHNMREEMEHASMVLEWIRRNSSDFAGHLKTYLFTSSPILEVEQAAEGQGATPVPPRPPAKTEEGFTVGPLKRG